MPALQAETGVADGVSKCFDRGFHGVRQLGEQQFTRTQICTPIGATGLPQDLLRACSIRGQIQLKPLSALGLYFSRQPETPLGGCINQLVFKQHVECEKLLVT